MKQISLESSKGYEFLNPACTNASLAMLAQAKETRQIFNNVLLPKDIAESFEKPQFVTAGLDFLESQGVIELTPQGYHFTEDGLVLAQDIESIKMSVSVYNGVVQVLKRELGWRHEDHPIARLSLAWPEDESKINKRILEGLVPAATTYLHEKKLEDADGQIQTAAKMLYANKALNVDDLGGNNSPFIKTLKIMGVLFENNGMVMASGRGKKLLRLAGYAELILSYYEMMQEMETLADGRKKYGLEEDINRDPELNANASNGISDLGVTQHIAEILETNQMLRKYLTDGAFIDYGSGGGGLLMRVMRENSNVKHAYGIDNNHLTNKEAARLTEEANLSDKIDFIDGSMADHIILRQLKSKIISADAKRLVAATSFIPHDIGPDLFRKFLAAHAEVFKGSPLIITETFRMPMELIIRHPQYQASSFQFMHTASGQNLYTEKELEEILNSCGYVVLDKKPHSSIPGLTRKKEDRQTTIATCVTRFRKAA